jgi:signal transduction histidine kinase
LIYEGIMIEASAKLKYILLVDVLLLILCVAGVININQKANLPFEISRQDSFNFIIISENNPYNLTSKDKLLSIDGFKISNDENAEFITDRKNIDELVVVKVAASSGERSISVKLTEYYSLFFITSTSITALLFFIISLFVLIKKNENQASHIFHWASVGTALIMCTTWANQNTYPEIVNYILRSLFHFAYIFTPAFFVHFAFVFPRDNERKWRTFIKLNYITSFLLAALSTAAFINTSEQLNTESISNYLLSFTFIRIYAAVVVITSIIIFFTTYFNEKGEVERKKLKWLLLGFVVGPLGFIVFWVLPKEFLGTEILPEEVIILLELAIPITFAIAIIKYHILDIDEVLNRSIVYGIVISILLVLYSLLLGVLVSSVHIYNQSMVSVVSAVSLALLFQPIKINVQRFVDKYFFRIQYNFRKELNRFISDIKNYNDINSLGEYLIREIDILIPVDKIAFSMLDSQTGKLFIKAQNNFDLIANKSLRIKPETLEKKLFHVAAVKYKVENDADTLTIFQNTLSRWKINLVVPIKSVMDELYGFIILGNKKSGSRFSIEDVDLLKDIGINAGSTIERIKLQEQLIREKIEVEKLEELNQHKSMFVSTVSHDLKTPLTSIKIFSEMLLENEKSLSDKSKNHLEIIEGETNRLTRLINNVLDFSKIEKGVRGYSFREIHINKVVKEVIGLMQYTLKMKGFKIETNLGDFNDLISGDSDAITEAMENIVSNAIRFSKEMKEIKVSTYSKNNFVCIDVEDNGIGIEQPDIEKIFDPFFRSENAKTKKIDGTGLGLPIVKHIVGEHKGKILIKSTLDQGSIFTLCFPELSNNNGVYNEENINH